MTDIVEGPVGSASLVDPSRNPDGGADLGALPGVDDIRPDDPLANRPLAVEPGSED